MFFKISTIVLLIIVIISNIIFLYNFDFTLPFDLVDSYNLKKDLLLDGYTYWFSLRDVFYNGFFSEDMLYNYIDEDNLPDLDYSQYTYIITIGHEMKSLKYSIANTKNRRYGVIPKQFIGDINLSKEKMDKIYIYRIKKMDIDCDYHNRSFNVSWVE